MLARTGQNKIGVLPPGSGEAGTFRSADIARAEGQTPHGTLRAS